MNKVKSCRKKSRNGLIVSSLNTALIVILIVISIILIKNIVVPMIGYYKQVSNDLVTIQRYIDPNNPQEILGLFKVNGTSNTQAIKFLAEQIHQIETIIKDEHNINKISGINSAITNITNYFNFDTNKQLLSDNGITFLNNINNMSNAINNINLMSKEWFNLDFNSVISDIQRNTSWNDLIKKYYGSVLHSKSLVFFAIAVSSLTLSLIFWIYLIVSSIVMLLKNLRIEKDYKTSSILMIINIPLSLIFIGWLALFLNYNSKYKELLSKNEQKKWQGW